MKICSRCVLPETFPGIHFDEDGVCQYCLRGDAIDRAAIRRETESFLASIRGSAPQYDVVVAYSGGKDSTYALKYLAEGFRLRIAALTIDNDFISETAIRNARSVPSSLGVDHYLIKPTAGVLRKTFRKSLEEPIYGTSALSRASAICNSCIQIINTQVLNFATRYQVPVVAGGYIGGQIPSNTGVMKQNLAASRTIRQEFLNRLKGILPDDALRYFVQYGGELEEVTVINPMTYLALSEESIIAEIQPLGWMLPADTGQSSTNCQLNDYAIASHMDKHHYHPYVFETAMMVRLGVMGREEALGRMSKVPCTDVTEPIRARLYRD